MIANMSALPESAGVSTERPTFTPASSNSATIGMPKPMRISEYGETLTVVRVSASARISSRVHQTA
jgi:hypothetical protein